MDREILSHLPVLVSVAKLAGFAAAAASLNMSPSAVSHAVRAVEDRLGEPLFARTTRSVRLTEAGARFLASIGPALEDIDKATESLATRRGEITGVLRINAPRVAVLMALAQILKKLARSHPRLVVETHTNDGFVDIVADGFDAGIRLGEAVQQDMVAVRLTQPFKAIMVASPEYLASHGEPVTLADLSTHNCIGFRLLGSGSLYEWDVTDGERQVAVQTTGTAVITDSPISSNRSCAPTYVRSVYDGCCPKRRCRRTACLLTSRGVPRLRRSCAPLLRHLVDRRSDDLAGWRWPVSRCFSQ
jgi:DNA-binding transcriptional LysR family regulator